MGTINISSAVTQPKSNAKKTNINDSKKVLCSINDIADKRKQTKIIIILMRWWWWWWCALVARSFRLRIFVYAIAAHQTADIIILSCHLRLILFFSWQTRKWRPLAFHMINHRNALTRYFRQDFVLPFDMAAQQWRTALIRLRKIFPCHFKCNITAM